MIGIVVAAHGDLAQALLASARQVVPAGAPAAAVGIAVHDDAASFDIRLQDAMEQVTSDQGVLMLTDMFGGTPSNVGLTKHQAGRVEVLTGANLPMLIKALQLCGKELDLATTARQVKEYGQRSIAVASEVLSAANSSGGEGTPA